MREIATTQQRLEVLRGQDARARSCAALVFAFHGGLRPPSSATARHPPPPLTKQRRIPRIALPSAPEVEEPVEEAPARTAYEILKWAGMVAAIAAPWVLLLSG